MEYKFCVHLPLPTTHLPFNTPYANTLHSLTTIPRTVLANCAELLVQLTSPSHPSLPDPSAPPLASAANQVRLELEGEHVELTVTQYSTGQPHQMCVWAVADIW